MIGKGLPVVEERVLTNRERYQERIRLSCERGWAEKGGSSILERERISRTDALLSKLGLKGKAIADLGCGDSPFSLKESSVTGVDAAQTALNRSPPYVKRIKGCLPYVRLLEESFDTVLLTDVIAEIEPHLRRLLLSEASILMKREAFCICSSELDFASEDPLSHFLSLLRTEFDIIELRKSYHRLYIYLRDILDAPSRFVQAAAEQSYRCRQLEKRSGFSRLWFYVNTLKWVSYIWHPFTHLKKRFHNRSLLLFCEKISEILWGEGGLSHVIVLCKRKSLYLHQ
ncbi:MAG: class I SAM-dependent methyltransferase [Chlamydiales bacterium]|nr:class I SAM-dependent methyltransferase [Chlamydiales bacterium]